MAEAALIAFGRYVRMQRERKGLSLEDAAALTRIYPDPLHKGYLSRVENGLTRVGFAKMIAIARAYDVPVDVFAERLWLDLELERMDPPETEGVGFRELTQRGSKAMNQGRRWRTYGYLRDAVPVSRRGDISPTFRDREEQMAVALMNAAKAARMIGALRFALHELLYVESLHAISDKLIATHSIALANTYHALRDLKLARHYADVAIRQAGAAEGKTYLGHCQDVRGFIAHDEEDLEGSLSFFREAIESYRAAGCEEECANAYCNMAQTYLDEGRLGAARRASQAAEKIASRLGLDGIRARVRLLYGDCAFVERKTQESLRHWREAAEIARNLKDRTLLFKADFPLFRHALENGQRELAKSLGRKLDRLAPWIPPHTFELVEFRRLAESRGSLVQKRNQPSQ